MNVCLFLIILGTITVLGEQPGNQQETSINPKAKRYYEPGMRVRGYSYDHGLLLGFFSFIKARHMKIKTKVFL